MGRVPRSIDMTEARAILEGGLATPIPIVAASTARGRPFVGVDPEYFAFRDLVASQGRLPVRIGEVVLGQDVARELGLGPGDTLLTDQRNLYDLASSYPLRVHVVGVLRETGSADDGAVFCDVKTAWVALGIGHGHDSADRRDGNDYGFGIDCAQRPGAEHLPRLSG